MQKIRSSGSQYLDNREKEMDRDGITSFITYKYCQEKNVKLITSKQG